MICGFVHKKPSGQVCRVPKLWTVFYIIEREYGFGFGKPRFLVKCPGKMCEWCGNVVVAGRERVVRVNEVIR